MFITFILSWYLSFSDAMLLARHTQPCQGSRLTLCTHAVSVSELKTAEAWHDQANVFWSDACALQESIASISGMSVQEKDIKAGLWCFLTHLGVFLNWIEMIQVYVDWGYVHWSRLIAATAGLTLAHQMKHFAPWWWWSVFKRENMQTGERRLSWDSDGFLCDHLLGNEDLTVKTETIIASIQQVYQRTASSEFVCYDLFVQY